MDNPLIPKRFIPRALFRFPPTRFPSLLDDFEDEMEHWNWEQSGLTVSEDEKSVYIEAQMPGLKADDIHVTIEKGVLRIQGEREDKEEDKEKRFHRKASYSFNYRLTLPGQINEENPDARYKDGVMTVTFNKTPEKTGKRIQVKGS